MGLRTTTWLLAAGLLLDAASARAELLITEWQYNGSEYIEFTNMSSSPLNAAGWSFDDDSRTPNTVDLSPFGVVQPGESVILAEVEAGEFRTEWNLPASVKVIGSNTTNFGRDDEINIFDAADNLVDRLNYGDNAADTNGSIRTQSISGNPISPAALGTNNVFQWTLSTVGDRYGSYTSLNGFIGNPGVYVDAVEVPEPISLLLLLSAAGGMLGIHNR